MKKMPQWKLPQQLESIIEENDGQWEDDRREPIILTVISGTTFEGRDIPLMWEIEFDPTDDVIDSANERLEKQGIDPDGYEWGQVIQTAMNDQHPELTNLLHFGDCEASTCVAWTESEESCRLLMETTWRLMYDS